MLATKLSEMAEILAVLVTELSPGMLALLLAFDLMSTCITAFADQYSVIKPETSGSPSLTRLKKLISSSSLQPAELPLSSLVNKNIIPQ